MAAEFSKSIVIRPLKSGPKIGNFSVVAFDDETGEAIYGAYITPDFAQANTYAESIADYVEGDTVTYLEEDGAEVVALIEG